MNEISILKNRVQVLLEAAVQEYCHKYHLNFKETKIRLEYSRDEKFGDYSTAVALENKKVFNRNPTEIAEELRAILQAHTQTGFLEFVNVSKPGFVNFRISSIWIKEYIRQTVMTKDMYPKVESQENINFEFVSANPTGPLNIVSARSAAMGDAITRLLKKIGHHVHNEFYVNDYGNQVFLLGVACLYRLRESHGEPASYQKENDEMTLEEMLDKNILPYESYRGEYISEIIGELLKDSEKKSIIDEKLSLRQYHDLAVLFSNWAVEFNLATQKKDLEQFGVHFDQFYSEKSLHDSGSVIAVLDELNVSGDIKVEDGKKVFLSTRYGDDKDRVVVRDDGRPTYLLADIAYHQTKIKRGFTKIINIWGPDHHGYIARLKGAMQSMGYKEEDFKVIIAQQVNLIEKGEKIKMSKRLGQLQTMKDLFLFLGEHYRDVGRYFFLMRTLDAPLDFDLDLAKDESDKNPVFYLQYAHARICSIFREIGDMHNFESFQMMTGTEERSRLLFWIARFPEEVFDAARAMEPHRFINYLQNLAHAFSRFYIQKENRLKDSDLETQKGLGYLCEATRICLEEGLHLLGISAPDKMEQHGA